MLLSAPEPLNEEHTLEAFHSGEPDLDFWLKKRALVNQMSGASRTFVLCHDKQVVGYYALASGSANPAIVPGRFRRNMPDPIPVVLLGRLAIDLEWQGRGRGRGLVRDAALRVLHAAEVIGIRGMVVHALNDNARAFYLGMGFSECTDDSMTLVMTLQDIRATLAG